MFANDPWHGKQGVTGEACLLRAGIGARTQPPGWGTLSMIAWVDPAECEQMHEAGFFLRDRGRGRSGSFGFLRWQAFLVVPGAQWQAFSSKSEQASYKSNNKLVFALNVRNQHANTDARLLPAPHDIVVVYWRQRHTRLGPPSPSLYGHSGHGLTHNTETMQSITYARLSRLPLY